MKQKKIISIITLGALAIATVFGALVYRTVQAAGSAQAANPDQAAAYTGRGFGGGERGGFSNQDQATALGITVDELNTAYQTANAALLKQAVTDGLITQAQADEITSNGAAFPLGGRWADWLNQKGLDYDTFLAQALGITTDELQAAHLKAFNVRIDQAVTNGNLTQSQADLLKGQYALYRNAAFQASMKSAYESAVKQAVTDGVITQAQADQILANSSGLNFLGPKGMELSGMRGLRINGGHRGGGPNGFGPKDQAGGAPADTATPGATTTP